MTFSGMYPCLNVKERGKKGKKERKESGKRSGGFKACNCQLHRLWQDAEFVDMSFLQRNPAPGANLCPPTGREKSTRGIGLICGCRTHDMI